MKRTEDPTPPPYDARPDWEEVRQNFLYLGPPELVFPLAERMGVFVTFKEALESQLVRVLEARRKCSKHWVPRPPFKPPVYCRRCATRSDVLPSEDALMHAEVFRGLFGVSESRMRPTGVQLRDAGWIDPKRRVPERVADPLWREVLAGAKHDLKTLEAAVRIAREARALPKAKYEPEALPNDYTPGLGRRWSF